MLTQLQPNDFPLKKYQHNKWKITWSFAKPLATEDTATTRIPQQNVNISNSEAKSTNLTFFFTKTE